MPQNTPYATPSPSLPLNIVGANAGVQVKTGRGMLRGFSVNTGGTTSTLVLYDGTSTAGTKLGTWSTTLQVNFDLLNLQYLVGLFAVTTGTLSDITIQYV
jgi:hypothetical protein